MHAERDEPPDRAVAALALRQHGVVASRQLRALGLARGAVAHRVAVGRLHRVHLGVYAVGHRRLSVRGRWMAAVLSCGPQAMLSHTSAAALWGLRPSTGVVVDVAVRTAGGVRARAGIRVHRLGDLPVSEVDVLDAIPVTTVARTLLDLAAILPPRRLERALDQAEVMGHFDLRALRAILDAHPGHHGGGALRRALSSHEIGSTLSRSELEERFLALCDAQKIRRPQVNARVAGLEVDFCFAAARLVVEVDGFRFHRTRAAFERDRERDAILARAGFRVLRFTHRQLTADPGLVADALRSSA
jgi:very-short-patch-repair endonuclease